MREKREGSQENGEGMLAGEWGGRSIQYGMQRAKGRIPFKDKSSNALKEQGEGWELALRFSNVDVTSDLDKSSLGCTARRWITSLGGHVLEHSLKHTECLPSLIECKRLAHSRSVSYLLKKCLRAVQVQCSWNHLKWSVCKVEVFSFGKMWRKDNSQHTYIRRFIFPYILNHN